ncbi:MAG: outer membrane protein assembly factor BamB [Gammaproteobacteria bacterium]
MKLALLGPAAIAVLGLAGCGVFGKDEPVDPPAELTEFERSLEIERVWRAEVGDTDPVLRLGLVAATDGSRVYAAAHDGQVAAYDAVTGERAWVAETELPLSAGPAVGDGVVALGSTDGDLIALEAEDGASRWHIRVGSEILAAPVVGRGIVVAQTVDGRLRAFDAANGSEIWEVEQTVPALSLRGGASPVIAGDAVLAGFANGHLLAVSLAEGDELWDTLISPSSGRTVLERLVDINSAVQVVGDDVYVVNFQGRVTALALESGQVLWARELSSHRGLGVDLASVYITTELSEVVALDRRGGDTRWSQESMLRRELTAPVPFGRAVVVGDLEGYLHWLSPDTGELIGRMHAGDASISGRPLAAGERLFVLTDAGELTAYIVERAPEGD